MKPKKQIFITGASGFIGSHLAEKLAEKESNAINLLIRPFNGVTAGERWKRIADWLELSDKTRKRISVFSGDLDSPDLGLSCDDARFLKTQTDEIIHTAASTSFSEKKRAQVFQTNIDGLNNLLSFFAGVSFKQFHHISTAYVAGITRNPCMEAISRPSKFLNPYEEAKHQAELLIRKFCFQKNIRLVIYRPSIVYGNSITGKTFRFNALYHPVRSVAYIRDLFIKDILQNNGTRAQMMGICLNQKNQSLYLPVCLEIKQGKGLNLVPINYCIDSIVEIMKNPAAEGIFHIINDRNTTMEELILFTKKFLNVSGISIGRSSGRQTERIPSPLDLLLQRSLETYKSYIADTRIFNDSRAAKILDPSGIDCPKFSYPVFKRCMTYAIDHKWGKSLGF